MLQGVCVDPGQTNVLNKEASYFLFPAGNSHYFVSKFPNKKSHRGCFESNRFQLMNPPEPEKHSTIESELKIPEYEQLSLLF
ncbi:hypothetical protein [Peribacillus aracenensis]|uniref:hypothetical protein n=1 Tax=Peribacillus aracenensis TaxID=2976708 RepID=UPI0021A3A7E1|nr:hypothetical protein [Peribacillus sp. BBB004]